ncbi:MAG: anti-sigma factor [Kiloniellales bacterium]
MADELDDIEALAAGYVLGQLSAEERAEAARRLAGDADFARQVTAWEERLSPLAEAVEPVEPSPGLWQKIEGALPAERRTAARPPLLQRLGFWRWSAGLASAAAVALAAVLILQPAAPPRRWVAMLGEGGSQPALLVTVDLEQRSVTIRPVTDRGAAALQPRRALELWWLGEGGAPPRSLGLVDPQVTQSLALPISVEAIRPGAAFAISLEPEGGSPTGQPTGPVIFHGALLALGGGS